MNLVEHHIGVEDEDGGSIDAQASNGVVALLAYRSSAVYIVAEIVLSDDLRKPEQKP